MPKDLILLLVYLLRRQTTILHTYFLHVHALFTACRLLSTAQGSLLDDEALVNALQSSKKTSEEVGEQLQVAGTNRSKD